MKLKQRKSSYEVPEIDVQHFEAEGILCVSTAEGQNEAYEDYEKEYTFTFTM